MDCKKYFDSFIIFLSNYRAAGTQQFVFLKSLLYLPKQRDGKERQWGSQWIHPNKNKIEVDLDFLAVPFTKYYWDMFYKFRLRQSAVGNQYGDKDVNIHKFFEKNYLQKQNIDEKPPKDLKDLADDKFAPLRKDVIRKSMREVLRALNDKGFWQKYPTTKRNPKTGWKSGYIPITLPLKFDIEHIEFFQTYDKILENAVNYELTLHLEKINKFVPQVAKKVLIEIPRGDLSDKEKKEYKKLYKNQVFTCFYCNKEFQVGKNQPARDHVVPFDYVLSDELYNSVPACKTCNAKKSNLLPDEEILKEVIKRNETLKNTEGYTQKEFEKLYRYCKERYHGDRPLFHFQYNRDVAI